MIEQLLDQRYKIKQNLSQGGLGRTFIAEDTKRPGNPTCVVKQLHPASNDPRVLLRAKELFKREAETLEKLGEHPKIPRLLAYFEENEEFYLVQEYIPGHTLSLEIVQGKPLTEKQVTYILIELLEILEFVHSQKVIHRDIKPDNIIRRREDNKLVLIDFGAVKEVTTTGQNNTALIGTPGYMPPEQIGGIPQLSSDIYALGVMGIQALTGENPPDFVNVNYLENQEICCRSLTQVSPKFGDILDKMVRQNYQQRYPSAKEALAAISQLIKPSRFQSKLVLISLIIAAVLTPIVILIAKFSNPISNSPKLVFNGQVIEGNLSLEDGFIEPRVVLNSTAFPDHVYFRDVYIFEGHKNQSLKIEMISQELDPYITLQDPDGKQIAANDDISISNSNAKIKIKLPKDGIYQLFASSSQAGETGAYQLWGNQE